MKDIERVAVASSVIFWIAVLILSFTLWGLARSFDMLQTIQQMLN